MNRLPLLYKMTALSMMLIATESIASQVDRLQ
jgi:hypothetical protein